MGVAPEKLVAKNCLAKSATIVPTPHVELKVFTDLSFSSPRTNANQKEMTNNAFRMVVAARKVRRKTALQN